MHPVESSFCSECVIFSEISWSEVKTAVQPSIKSKVLRGASQGLPRDGLAISIFRNEIWKRHNNYVATNNARLHEKQVCTDCSRDHASIHEGRTWNVTYTPNQTDSAWALRMDLDVYEYTSLNPVLMCTRDDRCSEIAGSSRRFLPVRRDETLERRSGLTSSPQALEIDPES
jgi:hypothetical protein